MNELRAEIDKLNIKVITVSTDLPYQIAAKRNLHGLQATMLSDHSLEVIDAFGLRNTAFHSGFGLDGGVEALPVPATLLIDSDGRLVWIDLSKDYQRRSDPLVVLNAIKMHFY